MAMERAGANGRSEPVHLGVDLVDRGRTAMHRTELSRPLSLALSDAVIDSTDTVFDYGCGRGSDISRLRELGFDATGWDPVHAPANPKRPASVVNLGYVVNVIESSTEREAALVDAWQLASRLLVVSARLDWDVNSTQAIPCGDGLITSRGTFQKFFSQDELRDWIQATLQVDADAAAPGVFYVFRTPEARELHLARSVRRFRDSRPSITQTLTLEKNRELFEPLLTFLASRGRPPVGGELPEAPAIIERLGSIARAVRLLGKAVGTQTWEHVAIARQRELLVYVALATFRRRPPLKALPADLQADVRAFFGSYSEATKLGRELLFSTGQQRAISDECGTALVGKLTPDALYVHVTAIKTLPVLLQVYEGCARTLLGDIPQATLVKLRRDKPKVSYLCYPTFESAGHPELAETFVASLRTLRTDHYDYRQRENPPVLHRKECFVSEDHAQRSVFAELTEAELAAGLLDHSADIGTLERWEARLSDRGYAVVGHRLERIMASRSSD
jgi:DNA phosphorothioation-associated putative methyltransferase